MAFISDELYNEICMSNDIVDYASSFMTLKKSGKSYMACCPFHREKSPSFNIDRDKQLFHCFGCGASGNFVQLVMRLEGLDYADAIKQLADRAGLKIPENGVRESTAAVKAKERILEMNKSAARFFYRCLTDPHIGTPGRAYFAQRRLSKKTIIQFGLGYAPDSCDALLKELRAKGYKDEQIIEAGLAVTRKNGTVDKYRNRVIFPIIDVRGRVIGFGGRVIGGNVTESGFKLAKYLNSPQTPVFDKGANLFALNLAKNSNEKDLILCEGYMDVITVHQAGISNCVATLGTAITEPQAKLMLRYCREVLICYDMDEAGTKAALRAIDVIAAAGGRSRIIRITGAKDPDEYITKYGVSGFKKAVEKAVPSTEFKISLVKKQYDLTDTDGKIRFVEETAQVLAGLSDAVEVDAYIKKTALDTGISAQAINGKYVEYRSRQSLRNKSPVKTKEEYKRRELQAVNSGKPPQEKVTNAVLGAEKRLLSLMAQSKRLCRRACSVFNPEEFSNNIYQTLAKRMNEYAQRGENADASEILNEFSGDPQAENMAAAVFFNREVYADNDKTLYDLIYTIKKNRLVREKEATEDPRRIMELINKEKQLEKDRVQWQSNN